MNPTQEQVIAWAREAGGDDWGLFRDFIPEIERLATLAYEAGRKGAQPEQEPVAWYEPESYSNVTIHKKWAKENGWLPLYTAPPQREWQGLTDEEIIAMRHTRDWTAGWTDIRYARAIEAKLREKNA